MRLEATEEGFQISICANGKRSAVITIPKYLMLDMGLKIGDKLYLKKINADTIQIKKQKRLD